MPVHHPSPPPPPLLPPPPQSLVLRLQQALISCAASVESGDFSQSDNSISELVDFLNSVDESSEKEAFQVLTEIYRYVTLPSLDQTVMDALSFELPKAVARFACASRRWSEVAGSVIGRFVESCSPRDMLSVLCEALDSPSRIYKAPGYFAPLLSELTKGSLHQRRMFATVVDDEQLYINTIVSST